MKRILILSPHTDDGESGCGASTVKFLEELGTEIYYACFSFARLSLPKGFDPGATYREVINATRILGVPSANLILFDYEVRSFPRCRQKILEDMIKLGAKLKPDIVFMPSSYDTHQDHSAVFQEGFRAFKRSSILGYENVKNNLRFKSSCFVHLEKYHLSTKIRALESYKSQSHRGSIRLHEPLARVRGYQCGVEYAECFEVVRWIIK